MECGSKAAAVEYERTAAAGAAALQAACGTIIFRGVADVHLLTDTQKL